MDLPDTAPHAAPARRTDVVLVVLFLFFLVLTVLCLHALWEPSVSAPPSPPETFEYASPPTV